MWIQPGRPRQRCTINGTEVAEMKPLRRRNEGPRVDAAWWNGDCEFHNNFVVLACLFVRL